MQYFPETTQFFPQALPALVCEAIAQVQTGRVEFQGTYWDAEFYRSDLKVVSQPEQVVSVIGIRGLTLLVMP